MSELADRDQTTIDAPWLDQFPTENGVARISVDRPFAHDELDYDNQYNSPGTSLSGRGVVNILRRFNCDTSGPVLELGCGTGASTIGLCGHTDNPWVLVTDSSTAFLNIVSTKLQRLNIDLERVRFAVLSDTDLDRLPARSVSAIVLRSVLHHFLDVPAWLQSAARVLRPGGTIVCEEPCAQGYLNMGLIAQAVADNKAAKISSAQRAKAQILADTMKSYNRRDIDKSTWEDKHIFRPEEIATWGDAANLRSTFLANMSFEMFAEGDPESHPNTDFSDFFRSYMHYCMNFGEKDAAKIWQAAEHLLDWVAEACSGMREPHLMGIFVLQKRAAALS